MYAPNIGARENTRKITYRSEGSNTIRGDFNTSLSTVPKLSRQKINKGMLDLNCMLAQMDLTDREQSIQLQRHTSSPVHMNHSPS